MTAKSNDRSDSKFGRTSLISLWGREAKFTGKLMGWFFLDILFSLGVRRWLSTRALLRFFTGAFPFKFPGACLRFGVCISATKEWLSVAAYCKLVVVVSVGFGKYVESCLGG